MSKMVIETYYRDRAIDAPAPREWKLLRPRHVEGRHGWASPEAYVKECSRRFKHRNPRPYKNGLEMDGDVGTMQRIYFEG